MLALHDVCMYACVYYNRDTHDGAHTRVYKQTKCRGAWVLLYMLREDLRGLDLEKGPMSMGHTYMDKSSNVSVPSSKKTSIL